ncbi:MAG: benzoyl-CoA-dihydrodiol lyase [Alphaproteobacteria bacterium]|nr:benzoyl-CoA-dihydrodiol lyase [Alphaproteobacteria bacterium]
MTEPVIDFRTAPERYRHWKLRIEGAIAQVVMDVDERGGLMPGYELKLNSYDLGVDIELADIVTRLRFEHPEVACVVVTSGKERVFCAGANIRMLNRASHAHKVNFCKFTNETRLSIEEASERSGQVWITAVSGSCAGGGYELALATDHILMADDGNSAVSLPEVPLLAVLPGTGGLTRLVDKRKVRRDRADFFCTTEEGVRGRRAVDWRLVDEVVPRTRFKQRLDELTQSIVDRNPRPAGLKGIALPPLAREIAGDRIAYPHLTVEIDRERALASFAIAGPAAAPGDPHRDGAGFWLLALARAFDDAMLHLRANEPTIGTWLFRSAGDPALVAAHDAALAAGQEKDWLWREIGLLWKRVLKRLDMSSRSLFAAVEPGSCFAGTLLEIVLACDRSWMLDGKREGDNRPPAAVTLNSLNFGAYPMGNGLSRMAMRHLAEPGQVDAALAQLGRPLDAKAAEALGLVTFAPDDIDWEDELRIGIEERASFSPDALTGMEQSLRYAGPETMETKIFGRLTAWQNWIFQRPNAVGAEGALKRYGTGLRGAFDRKRV